jgi:hypothetical protein
LYSYFAYENRISSEIELPGYLETGAGDVDISIAKKYSRRSSNLLNGDVSACKIDNGVLFDVPAAGLSFAIFSGREIQIILRDNYLAEHMHLPLYGFAIATILHQQGYHILHASTVEVGGKVIAIVGGKGYGKSTLAAKLVSKGHRLVSDDVTALDFSPVGTSVLPGVPGIKLWPDAITALGGEPDNYPLLYPTTQKRHYLVFDNFVGITTKLDTVVMLDHGNNLELKELKAVEKMLFLTSGCYFNSYIDVFSLKEREEMFQRCAALSQSVKIIKLVRPRTLEKLDESCQMIERYLEL